MIPKEVLQKVRHIEIKTKRIVDSIISGGYHSAFKGKGMEFSEVRGYIDGDDIRTIDWNVTARMGDPYVKKHVEERELTVMLMVDASASGNFGTVNKFKGETAVELCALLAFSAIKNNDRVGLIIFTSDVELYIPPKKGKNHVLHVIRELLFFKPTYPGTNISEALKFLNRVQTKKSVTFLVSDFFAPSFAAALRISSKRHDLIAITVNDPREMIFPDSGLIELEDAESGATVLVDSGSKQFRTFYKQEMEKRLTATSTLFKTSGIDEIRISTESGYVDPLVHFFKKREKMLRR
ncbi:MAG TPA: DUF58 domain-containing protein [Chitinispirillaceae bacterium]|nr:DUF58 domain-containing protein [Chitinispirillaceae bacterium]